MKGDVQWTCPVCQRSKARPPEAAPSCQGGIRMSHFPEPMVQR